MNVILVEPAFPANQRQFARALADARWPRPATA